MPHLNGRHVVSIDVTDPAAIDAELDAARLAKPSWIVDGLFGIGLNRPLDNHWRKLIGTLTKWGSPF